MSLRNGTLIVADNAMQTAMHSALTQDATLQPRSAKKGKSTLDEVEVSGVVDKGDKNFLCRVDETGKMIHVYGATVRYSGGKKIAGVVNEITAFLYEQSIVVPEGVDHCYLCLVVEPGFPFGVATDMEREQHCTLQFYCPGDTVFYINHVERIEVLAEITRDKDGILSCTQIYDGGDIVYLTYENAKQKYSDKQYIIPEFRLIADPHDIKFKGTENFDVGKIDIDNWRRFCASRIEYGNTIDSYLSSRKTVLTKRESFDFHSSVFIKSQEAFNARFIKIAEVLKVERYGINFIHEGLSYSYTKTETGTKYKTGTVFVSTEIISGANWEYDVLQKATSIIIYKQIFDTYNKYVGCEAITIPVTAEKADGKLHKVYATIKYENGVYTAEYQEDFDQEQHPETYSFVVCEYKITWDSVYTDVPYVDVEFYDSNIDKYNLKGLWLC